MSTASVFVGRWRDHSHASVLGDVVTLDVRWGGYLIAALATFVGFVGASLWSLLAFTIHQCRATADKVDGVYLQQQVLLRNPSSPPAAAFDFLMICWKWRKTKDYGVRAEKLKRRSFLLTLAPLFVFGTFVAAGVFVSEVAGKSYRSNNVLLNPGICGTVEFDIATKSGFAAFSQKIVNDTLAARAYVASCYGPSPASAECSLYPKQALKYNTTIVDCPFGTDPKGQDLCLFKQNNALMLDTGHLDSNSVLGINAAKENRVLVRKALTCSPLHVRNYVKVVNPDDPIFEFLMGPVYTGSGYNDITFHYINHTILDGVGYQVLAVYDLQDAWLPVPALQVENGEVVAVFMTANSVKYLVPTTDLFYSATTLVPDTGQVPLWSPDSPVSVMGCVDQFQICNPKTNPPDCTLLSNRGIIINQTLEIGLNFPQVATAELAIINFELSTTYNAVDNMGDAALLARNHLVETLSTGLPDNQWQLEVQGWFETSLAKIQANVVNYVSQDISGFGQYGYVKSPNANNTALGEARHALCSQQRVRNVGGYQTFSFMGLMIVICVGVTIIILSWTVEWIVACVRKRQLKKARAGGRWPKRDYREMARIADRKLQLQRMALVETGYKDAWEEKTLLDKVPVTKGRERKLFVVPTRREVMSEQTREKFDDYRYRDAEIPMSPRDGDRDGDGAVNGRQDGERNALLAQGPAALPGEHPERGSRREMGRGRNSEYGDGNGDEDENGDRDGEEV